MPPVRSGRTSTPRDSAVLRLRPGATPSACRAARAQDRHRPLLRRDRLDGARRAPGPGAAPTRHDALLRGRAGDARAPPGQGGEVHRRRRDGGVRRARAARGRRAACAARGLDLKAAIRDLNVELERTHGVRIEIRTGVNSGEVIAGDPTRDSSIRERRRRRRRRAAAALRGAGRDPHRRGDVPPGPRRDQRGAARAARPSRGSETGSWRTGCWRWCRARPRSPAASTRRWSGATRELALLESAFSRAVPRGVVPPVHGARPGGRREVAARRGGARRHRRPGARASPAAASHTARASRSGRCSRSSSS